MKSPKRSHRESGATVVEILVGVSIMAGLAAFGLFIALNQYRAYVLESDWNSAASMLQTARARAMSNINSSAHGFYVDTGDFVIFQGTTYATRNTAYDERVVRSSMVTAAGPTEIIFNRLRGDVSAGSGIITFSNGERSRTITLNDEGRISW